MSQIFKTIVTDIGAAKLSKASGHADDNTLATVKILNGAVGSVEHDPKTSDTAVPGQVYFGPIAEINRPDNTTLDIVFEIPPGEGGWNVHTIGIFDSDGDLFAIAKLTGAYKSRISEGAPSSIRYHIEIKVSNSSVVEITLPPGNTAATQEWVNNKVETDFSDLLNKIFHVGALYYTRDNRNPKDILGIGLWERVVGRFVVGYDPGQTEFNSVGKTGGSKTHTLTIAQLPPHDHELQNTSCAQAGRDNGGVSGSNENGTYGPGPAMKPTKKAGGGQPFPTLPPYFVANVWIRTA